MKRHTKATPQLAASQIRFLEVNFPLMHRDEYTAYTKQLGLTKDQGIRLGLKHPDVLQARPATNTKTRLIKAGK